MFFFFFPPGFVRVRESAAVLLCLLLGMGRFSLLLFFFSLGAGVGALLRVWRCWLFFGGGSGEGGVFAGALAVPPRQADYPEPSPGRTPPPPPSAEPEARPLLRAERRRGWSGGRSGEVAVREGGRKRRVPGKRPGRGIAGAWPRCLDGACCCLRCPFGCAWRLCWQSSAFKRAARKEPALVFFLMIEVLEWAAPIFALSRLFFFFLLFAH